MRRFTQKIEDELTPEEELGINLCLVGSALDLNGYRGVRNVALLDEPYPRHWLARASDASWIAKGVITEKGVVSINGD